MATKTISGEQVVLATLVDDAKFAVSLGVAVRKDDVDLVALERGLVPAQCAAGVRQKNWGAPTYWI